MYGLAKRRKFSLDFLILIFSGIVFLFCSFLLANDYTLFFKKFNSTLPIQKPVATITFTQNDIRTKKKEQLIWKKANNKDQLFLEDMVFSGNNSIVNINFEDGTKISLSENSVVEISDPGGQVSLYLKSGAISGFVGERAKIFFGKNSLTGRGSRIRLKVKKQEPAQLEVLTGKINLTAKDQSLEVFEGKRVKFDENGEIGLSPVQIGLRTPNHNQNIEYQMDKSLKFSWTVNEGDEQFLLEIAIDENFKNIIYSKITSKRALNISHKVFLNPGLHYWRIKQGQEGKIVSSPAQFDIKHIDPPTIIFPLAEQNFTVAEQLEQKKPLKNIRMRWESKLLNPYFRIKLFDRDSKREIKNTLLRRSQVDFKLPAGQYSWQVGNQTSKEGTPYFSKIKHFSVDVRPVYPAPELDHNQSFFRCEMFPCNQQFTLKNVPADVQSLWTVNSLNPKGEVIKSREIKTRNLYLNLKVEEDSDIILKVMYYDDNGFTSKPSSPLKVRIIKKVLLPAPSSGNKDIEIDV